MNAIAVVTGAARGLGLAISRALLAQGFSVVGIDLDATRLSQTASELGSGFRAKVADVSDAEAVKRVFAELEGLDVLVNNAGTCFMNDFLEISAEELHRQMAINFDSAFFCSGLTRI